MTLSWDRGFLQEDGTRRNDGGKEAKPSVLAVRVRFAENIVKPTTAYVNVGFVTEHCAQYAARYVGRAIRILAPTRACRGVPRAMGQVSGVLLEANRI